MGRVLIVDDSEDTCRALGAILTRSGHHAVCANSVASAMKQLRQELPDAVIVDLMMPYESGIDLLEQVRGDERTKDLPVIVYSAVSERRYVQEALQAGASDYWLKGSVPWAQLHEKLTAYLRNSGVGWAEPPTAHPLHMPPA